MRRYAILAAIALASAGAAPGRAQEAPPLTVTVRFDGLGSGSAVLPVCFSAPVPKGTVLQPSAWLNGGPAGTFLAQATPAPKAPLDGKCDWYDVKALLPRGDNEYLFEWSGEPLLANRPVVVTVGDAEKVKLDAGQAFVTFERKSFDVFDTAGVAGRTLVPRRVTDLVNKQQGVELILRDTIRHVDFTLKSELDTSFSIEAMGPVESTVLYKGTFAGGEREPKVNYQARLSLAASGVVDFDLRLDKGAFDPEVMKAASLKITLPLVLEHAAALSFGDATRCVDGRRYWKGQSRLSVAASGAYEFADADKSALSGAQKVTWADYRDDQAGIGMVWGARQWPAEVNVDYNEDIIELSVTPRATAESPAEARVCLVFYPPDLAVDALSGLAAAMDNPPAAVVNEQYLKAVTGEK